MDGKSDWEEQVAELHYRDVCEFAVGHGVAAEAQAEAPEGGSVCRAVRTVWMPAATVERVEPAEIADVVLGMEALAAAGGFEAMRKGLEPLPAG